KTAYPFDLTRNICRFRARPYINLPLKIPVVDVSDLCISQPSRSAHFASETTYPSPSLASPRASAA
ncbi:hypothetical protein, partial [Thiolapillus sp.]